MACAVTRSKTMKFPLPLIALTLLAGCSDGLKQEIDKLDQTSQTRQASLGQKIDKLDQALQAQQASLGQKIDKLDQALRAQQVSLDQKIGRLDQTLQAQQASLGQMQGTVSEANKALDIIREEVAENRRGRGANSKELSKALEDLGELKQSPKKWLSPIKVLDATSGEETGGGEAFVEMHPNGEKKSSGYIFGKNVRVGEWTFWYESGQKESEGRYVDHQKDGPWTFYHENGKKDAEGEYKEGQREGEWTAWNETGEKESEGAYEADRREGEWATWYATRWATW